MPRTSRSADGRSTPRKTSAPTPRLTSARAPASGVPSSLPLPSCRSQPASVSRASSAASADAIPGSLRFPVMTPTDPDRRHASARAARFGTYPSVLAASATLVLSWSLTASGRVRARDADAVDTAAARATSVSVAWAQRGLRRRLAMLVTVGATSWNPLPKHCTNAWTRRIIAIDPETCLGWHTGLYKRLQQAITFAQHKASLGHMQADPDMTGNAC